MKPLTHSDLLTLESYHQQRDGFRKKIWQHKHNRRVAIGPHTSLHFEDRLTMQYQVQEMLYAEKIIDSAAIDDELATYNPLIPDGNNFKATFMIEYNDPDERKAALKKLVGIEAKLWLQVKGFDKVYAIANEDLDIEFNERTTAVHFVRFQLTNEMIQGLKTGAEFGVGVDHPCYSHQVSPLATQVQQSLIADLD